MADGADKIEHHGTGHRARLRKRLFEQQGEGLHDHELVEYLLALAIPRRDTKQIAKDLIARYGSLSALLTADADSIMREKWMGETSAASPENRPSRGLTSFERTRPRDADFVIMAGVAGLSAGRHGASDH